MTRGRLTLCALAALAAPGAPVRAQIGDAHLLVVSGLGGEPRYSEMFHETAVRLIDAANERFGIPPARIIYLAEDVERDPDRIAERSTRDNVLAAIAAVASEAGPDDRVLLFMIGHGAERDGEPRINLPGPDLTGPELAAALDRFPSQTVAIINAASASGGFVTHLSGERRIVVTATRSTRERYETRFGTHFVDAFADDGADVDKDGRISVFEAFEYARREVERGYEAGNEMQTEHALLDDNGDGEGSLEPDPLEGDGRLANRFYLAHDGPSPLAATQPADPELAALYDRRRDLQTEIDALRGRKEEMESEAYERSLEDLLVDLATTSREIREREGGA